MWRNTSILMNKYMVLPGCSMLLLPGQSFIWGRTSAPCTTL